MCAWSSCVGDFFAVGLQFELFDTASDVLIVAVLLELGGRNQWLDALKVSEWSSLTKGSAAILTSAPFNAAWLLPNQGAAASAYYNYDGSLTTPPCSQDVTWVVMSDIGTLASAQLETMFPKSFGSKNVRPPQDLNGRVVSRLSQVGATQPPTLRSSSWASRRAQAAGSAWGYSFAQGPLKWGRSPCLFVSSRVASVGPDFAP